MPCRDPRSHAKWLHKPNRGAELTTQSPLRVQIQFHHVQRLMRSDLLQKGPFMQLSSHLYPCTFSLLKNHILSLWCSVLRKWHDYPPVPTSANHKQQEMGDVAHACGTMRIHTAPFSSWKAAFFFWFEFPREVAILNQPEGYEDSWPFLLSKKRERISRRWEDVCGWFEDILKFYIEVDSFPIRFL